MAYAAYREHPGVARARHAVPFHVLDVTVACTDAHRVRRAAARCADAGVLRCEPLLHERHSQERDVLRVRLTIRLPLASYAPLLHALIEAVPAGEIGRLVSWRDHLLHHHPHPIAHPMR